MHQQNLAILKGLVCVAWADGQLHSSEHELIEALLTVFAATPSEALEVREFAGKPRSLEDVPIHDLSYNDRRVLLTHAVLLSHVDGVQDAQERKFIDELCGVLRIPAIEATGIVEAAEREATALLPLLKE